MSTDLLLLADLHYVGPAGTERELPQREGRLALELAVRAVRDALRSGRPDAIVLLGDMLEDGSVPHAREDLVAVRDALAGFEIPMLVVPGNHDRDAELVAEVFACRPGLHQLAGCTFALFADGYDAEERSSRAGESMRLLESIAASGRPAVVVQHPPLLPRIEADYPYTIGGAEGLAGAYSAAGVALSLSGHYHAGQEPCRVGGVTYFTCPALGDRSFRYARARIADRERIEITTVSLAPPEMSALFDAHIHTDLAYCADDIDPAGALERLRALGIEQCGICEHADQLYFPGEGFWERPDANDRGAMARAAAAGHSRHAAYRGRASGLRSENVFVGLECDPAAGGSGLAALEEDLLGWDYLIGAVHYLVRGSDRGLSDADARRLFMAGTEQVVRAGVDVLAHPFRIFPRSGHAVPGELFRPVAEMLAAEDVAAEVNFHNGNRPDPRFFAACLACGARISVGSDSHGLPEVGELLPHLELLAEIGALERLEEVMWKPRRARGG